MNKIVLLMFLLFCVSCSFIRREETKAVAPVGIELVNSEDFESKEAALLEQAIYKEEVPSDVVELADNEVTKNVEAPVKENILQASTEEREYVVQENETLMMISFKIYGDLEKWRELKKKNRNLLGARNIIQPGMRLKYMPPEQEFNWKPEGLPYLIRKGDFLSRISKKIYGTTRRWVDLWNNNKVLIKNPNRIYVGLTLYYLQLQKSRQMASDKNK